MGFFDFLGNTGFSPVSDVNPEQQAFNFNNQPPAPVDAFGSVPKQPSTMERIWGSLGLTSDDISGLAGIPPRQPANLPSGMDMAGDLPRPSGASLLPGINSQGYGGMPMPEYLGPAPQDAFGSMPNAPAQSAALVKPVPLPPMPPGQNQPSNVSLDETQRMAPPGPSGWGQQGNTPFPIFGQPAQQAPAPPGAAGAPLSLTPSAAAASAPQQNFLQKLLGSKENQRNLQQIIGGIGKGAANIQGTGKFASFARGMGQGIEGAQERGDTQFKQQREANTQKLAVDAFEAKKPVWMSQADYFKARSEQQKALASGVSASKAWQTTPQGLAHLAESEVQNRYKTDMTALLAQKNALEPEEFQKQLNALQKSRDENLAAAYRKYNIDPQNNGSAADRPLDATRLNPMQMMGMPHGTYYTVPGSKTKDNPQGIVKMRDWNVLPPPGYSPGFGWNTGE